MTLAPRWVDPAADRWLQKLALAKRLHRANPVTGKRKKDRRRVGPGCAMQLRAAYTNRWSNENAGLGNRPAVLVKLSALGGGTGRRGTACG